MSFISFAQNFEDIMLWRALKHVERGFYIDVGANDPVVDSVTLAFYERGWHGINIEPMRQYFQRLAERRPRDLNLPVAVGERPGRLHFYNVPGTGLSTADPEIAQQHRANGREVLEEEVELTTLADICREHVHGPIHFLKVDVEGLEAEVLRGMDFTRWRPWILLVEATRPQSTTASHEAWQDYVLSAGYTFAYFDGLNQFYVANERKELLASFDRPPNYDDEFHLRAGHYYSHPVTDFEARLFDLKVAAIAAQNAAVEAQRAASASERWALASEQRALACEQRVAAAEQRAARAEQQASGTHQRMVEMLQLQHEYQRARAEIDALRTSRSWKLTRPLRWMLEQRTALREQGARERVRRGIVKVLRRLGFARASAALNPQFAGATAPPPQSLDMTPWARQVHEDLVAAIARTPTKE